MQELAWYVTLAVVAAIAAVFIRVAMHSREGAPYEGVQHRAYRIRALLFWGLLVAGAGVAWLTLRELPYAAAGNGAPQTVNATGYQWYWELDRDSLAAGQPVEFRVTSADVNHGFGIYDENTRLVAQTQAMPGYVNRLHHTFARPGTYRVMCLEYCGLAHHEMLAEITVTAP
ncbi:cytochrome C oxidase subunit I [Paracoccus sp. (in: a-proteobacteria)]|uniref:cytochrome C oxidase subunit I n=1 Tax=Paracoccus sp. TaxID=267 RepID=UPI00321FF5BC